MNISSHISAEYAQRLTVDYGAEIAQQIATDWQSATVPRDPSEVVNYVRLAGDNVDPNQKPVLFVQGFLAGIVANAPFGAAMASRGYDIIIADQHRGPVGINEQIRYDAAYTQAESVMGILRAEGLQRAQLDFVTHSYGSLVFSALARQVKDAGWRCLDGSKVAMLAPAGVRAERLGDFMRRYAALMRAGSNMEKPADGYWAFQSEMMAAGIAHFKANPRRAIREGWEVLRRRIDFAELSASGVSEIALMLFNNDPLFGNAALTPSVEELLATTTNVTSMSPISPRLDGGVLRGGRGSDHSDQQFNPERAAGAVAAFLGYVPRHNV